MSEAEAGRPQDVPPAEPEQPSAAADAPTPATDASKTETTPVAKRGWVGKTIGIASATTLAAAVAIGAFSIGKEHGRREAEAEERANLIDKVKFAGIIREYKQAVSACMKHPGQETAEQLDNISAYVNLQYLATHAGMHDAAKVDVLTDITGLHEQAEVALKAIQPRTRYVQHYLDRLQTRHTAILYRLMGARSEETNVWEAALKESDDRNERLKHLTPEERKVYMRQPVAVAPKK